MESFETPIRVLLVVDDPDRAQHLAFEIAQASPGRFDIVCRTTPEMARQAIQQTAFDIVVSDPKLSVDLGSAGNELPIVPLTSSGAPDLIERLIRQSDRDPLSPSTECLADPSRSRLYQQLEERNRRLGEFSYFVSHDLQAPLRELGLRIELIEEFLEDRRLEAIADCLHEMRSLREGMTQLIFGLLDLTRLEGASLERQPVELEDCADRAILAQRLLLDSIGVSIEREPLPRLCIHASGVKQVYQNLIGNAVKFRSQDRQLRIRLTAEQRDEELILGVQDNGIGVDPEYASMIFDPFRRLHPKSRYEGSGIGLTICMRVVEKHGGRIWVESNSEEEGSHFRFTLGNGERPLNGASEIPTDR